MLGLPTYWRMICSCYATDRWQWTVGLTVDLREEFAQAAARLDSYRVQTKPFEYFIVRDFFSPAMYEQILANLPEDAAYEPRRTGDMNEAQRGFFHLDRPSINNLPPAQHRFWLALRDWMVSQSFAEHFMRKFGPQVADRLAHEPAGSRLGVELKLIRDKENYALKPHTDAPSRVASLLLYLPRDASMRNHGTAIYEPKAQGFTSSGKGRHPFEDFNLVTKAEFLPNSGLGFLKSGTSFHGVELVAGKAVQRDMLMLNLRSTHESLGRRLRHILGRRDSGDAVWPLKRPARAELVG